MNTYYLKKFRKWAREFVKIYVNKLAMNKYDVRAGCVYEKNYLELNEAKKELIEQRRYYILEWCRDRKRKKLNKRLAKL